ncbi:3-hydroxy-3-isohexenylglutaryl-CoA/hydroxy-methylglutaryl-CoA like protein [Verticillium longisporum]|nr:3-hydroxy-3-isohexenylglutaryl-CoA/hydroxy-methylglutaryl-CoA like protein [Verticillium longisporum]
MGSPNGQFERNHGAHSHKSHLFALSTTLLLPGAQRQGSPERHRPARETPRCLLLPGPATHRRIAQARRGDCRVIQKAKASGVRVRAYISVVLGCPFEGHDVVPHKVAEIATDLLESGADEISLGDTTGMGTAPRTKALLDCMRSAGIRNEDLAMHFHDTYGQALVNTAVSLEHGIRTFDSSIGGLGGCPYSPGATGNVATENMVYFLSTLGMETGVDLDVVSDIGAWITGELGKSNESTVGKAVLGARSRA